MVSKYGGNILDSTKNTENRKEGCMIIVFNNYKATSGFIIAFVILYIIDIQIDLSQYLSAKGIDIIGHEYYRFVTGPFLHFNLIHMLANVAALFWVGYFLEVSLGSVNFVLFGVLSSTIAEIINSFIYRSSQKNIGASVYVFAFLGLIVVTQILKSDFPKFHLRTWYGNWLLFYAIIGNIPVFSFMGDGTLVLHFISFVTGVVIGLCGMYFGIITC